MSNLRQYLAEAVERKVQASGLVIWQDEAEEYGDVAATVCPAGAEFVRWTGSWYQLRRVIEGKMAGETPPSLVIYVPTVVPGSDSSR